jgi:hypothetical protein
MGSIFQKVMAVRKAVVFRKRELLYGWCYPSLKDEAIYINLERHGNEDPAVTYLHECLHIIYPTLSEAMIIKLTLKVWNRLSSHQRFILSRKLFAREWRTEL